MTQHVDTMVAHGHLFTMQGKGVGYIADGAVAIEADRIGAVGPTAELEKRFEATKTIDATNCAVLPGLVDGHMHTTLSLLRGVAQDAPNLSPLLLNPIRNIVPNFVYAGSGHEVKTVLVAGQVLVDDYQVTTVDGAAIRAEAQGQAQLLEERVAADPVHKKMVLLDAMAAGQL